MTGMNEGKRGFTLIELLIVVGIMTILAAIAIPNYLAAQTRSKAARVMADLNAVATALEAYAVDHNRYPLLRDLPSEDEAPGDSRFACGGAWGNLGLVASLSTPVSYLGSASVEDPFVCSKVRDQTDMDAQRLGMTRSYLYAKSHEPNSAGPHYAVWSCGPMGKGRTRTDAFAFHVELSQKNRQHWDLGQYDVSNGTTSWGYIMRYQK